MILAGAAAVFVVVCVSVGVVEHIKRWDEIW